MYKCEEGGGIVYKDKPCATDGKDLELKSQTSPDSFTRRLGREKGFRLEGGNKLCTLENLEIGFHRVLSPSDQVVFICGKPSDVTKKQIMERLPNGEILDQSPEPGMRFIQWITDRGYKFRIEWLEAQDVVENATLFSAEESVTERLNDNVTDAASKENSPLIAAIKTRCSKKWPGDYRQQEYCVNKQIEGARKLSSHSNKYQDGSEEQKIILRCMAKWDEGEGDYSFDYRQVTYCIEKEIDAYLRLRN